MKILENVSMKKFTTYKTGGNVKMMLFPQNEEELIEKIKELNESNEKYFIIGNGSNLIVDDNDFDGTIINLKELNNFEINGNELTCEAGVMLPVVANKMINESLSGLEFAVSIPGTVGASILNNAGAYGSEMANIVKTVRVLDENYEIKEFSNSECEFEYRDSIFKKTRKYIILSCVIELEHADATEMKERVEDRKKRRIESQPLEYPSAGSVFRNPSPEMPAGKLVEELGLKGMMIGGAQISEKHGNFIVNVGNATSNDVKKLIKLIKDKVKETYDIDLKLEIEILNWE